MTAAGGVCLFGGSFNPPHVGHVAMARRARERLRPERLVVLPAGRPPHKDDDAKLAPAELRLAMARLAFDGIDGVEVSGEEVRRPRPSWTVETVQAWRERLGPGVPLYWLVGTDSLAEFPLWREHHRILELCHLASVPRPGCPLDVVDDPRLDLSPEEREALRRGHLGGEPVEVSSSQVRELLAAGRPVDHLVPPAVLAFVRERGLYR